jgi:hypothetical protein
MLSCESKGVEAFPGTVNGNGNLSRMKLTSDLSMWRFQRSFYTYKTLLWPAAVLRRCILEDSRVWRLWQFGWRCEFYSIESSIRPINTALSAKLLDM